MYVGATEDTAAVAGDTAAVDMGAEAEATAAEVTAAGVVAMAAVITGPTTTSYGEGARWQVMAQTKTNTEEVGTWSVQEQA